MRLNAWWGLVALTAVSGCLEEDDYEGTRMRGDLGRGTFVYGCYNDSDSSCDADNDALPRALAVGARFDLRFSIESGPQPSVIAPASDFVRRVDGAFEVQSAGEFALLAVNGNREVIDLKHLLGAQVDEIRVQRGSELPSATLRLSPKQSVELSAVPFARGVKLGGALGYAWSSSDDKLLTVESLAGLHRVRVRAGNRDGSALLRVEAAGTTFEVSVQVGSGIAPEEPRDAGAALDAAVDAAPDASEESDAAEEPDAAETGDAAAPDAETVDAGGDV